MTRPNSFDITALANKAAAEGNERIVSLCWQALDNNTAANNEVAAILASGYAVSLFPPTAVQMLAAYRAHTR